MSNKDQLKTGKGPNDVGAIKRSTMHKNASLMDKKSWEKKYPGFSFSAFYRGGRY